MKTTMELPDELLREVRAYSRSTGVTMRELVVEGLRKELASQSDATRAVDDLMAMPNVTLLGETAGHWQVLRRLASRGGVAGPKVHDARVAAICLGHGVSELWTADRDFSWFPELRTRNPLVG